RHEHQRAIMRQELSVILVSLARQAIDMRFDVSYEPVSGGEPLDFFAGSDQTFIAGRRNLGIDDHRPLLGKNDDDVRLLHSAYIIAQPEPAPLGDVLPALGETRRLENAFEGNFAPPAEQLRIAPQSLGKPVRLSADGVARFDDQLDLLFQG